MNRVLIVDDEPRLLRALSLNLRARGYTVTTAITGTSAISTALHDPFDVVILDLGLPDIDGLAVVSSLREVKPWLPIVVLSARSASQEKVAALELGAVDYVTKPFDVAEFMARIRAAERRVGVAESRPVILGGVEIDIEAKTAQHSSTGERIRLTSTEWRILDVLLRRPGQLVPARELLSVLRGDPEHTDASYLRVYMRQLRRKLEPEPQRPRHLLTEPGMGYRYQP